ncbi:hypothetical protein ACLQ28_34035 [Micromonospora sp. DT201]|uniref:hypothetical protein n=1 Tax=Micromonospora sp. DT201 TaxID=3393442 RepID=UPI003CEE6A3F
MRAVLRAHTGSGDEIRSTIAAVILHRTPHLIPPGKTTHAASYALGPIHRVAVGATGTSPGGPSSGRSPAR